MVVEPVAMMLAAGDADGDAGVTRDEARACLARSFASIDTTGAGSLGYIAYSDWAERFLGDPNALPSPFETDVDHDNRITLAELTTKIRSEEHTSELQSLMRISYAVFCLKKKNQSTNHMTNISDYYDVC